MEIIFISEKSLKKFEEKLIEIAKNFEILNVREDKVNEVYVAMCYVGNKVH